MDFIEASTSASRPLFLSVIGPVMTSLVTCASFSARCRASAAADGTMFLFLGGTRSLCLRKALTCLAMIHIGLTMTVLQAGIIQLEPICAVTDEAIRTVSRTVLQIVEPITR